jgi:hypothetical protein
MLGTVWRGRQPRVKEPLFLTVRKWSSRGPSGQEDKGPLHVCGGSEGVCVGACWCNRGQGLIWRHRKTVIPPPPKAKCSCPQHWSSDVQVAGKLWHKCVQCCTVASELCVWRHWGRGLIWVCRETRFPPPPKAEHGCMWHWSWGSSGHSCNTNVHNTILYILR